MNKATPWRILLVDDHKLFLEGLLNLLTSEGFQVVGVAHDGFEALTRARQLRPELILMDVHMPNCDGVTATRLIKAEMPGCKIVMLTMSENEQDLFEAIKSGASGYLLKSLDASDFFTYLEELQSGHPPFSPRLAEKILNEFAHHTSQPDAQAEHQGRENQTDCVQETLLSPRRMQILALIAQGLTYQQAADTIGITERTVKYHMGEILECLHLHNRAQVIAYAARMGLGRTAPDPQSAQE